MGALSFTFVDVLVVAVMLVSAIHAGYRGFLREASSIVAWVAAAFASLFFGPALTHALHGLLSGWTAIAVAYGLIFLVVFLPLNFVSYRVSDSVRRSPVSAVDRALGVVFGAVRGLAGVAICYIVLGMFVDLKDQPKWITQARFLPLIQSSSETLLAVVPDQRGVEDAPRTAQVKPAAEHKAERKREEQAAARTGRKHAAKKPKKTYGSKDRRALDRLIEDNGGGGKQ